MRLARTNALDSARERLSAAARRRLRGGTSVDLQKQIRLGGLLRPAHPNLTSTLAPRESLSPGRVGGRHVKGEPARRPRATQGWRHSWRRPRSEPSCRRPRRVRHEDRLVAAARRGGQRRVSRPCRERGPCAALYRRRHPTDSEQAGGGGWRLCHERALRRRLWAWRLRQRRARVAAADGLGRVTEAERNAGRPNRQGNNGMASQHVLVFMSLIVFWLSHTPWFMFHMIAADNL